MNKQPETRRNYHADVFLRGCILRNWLIGALISPLLLFCNPAFALDGSVLKWIEPRTRAEAPQTIQLPQEWVKALDDIWNEGDRRGSEMAMCMDIASEKSTVDQRSYAAENLRALRWEQDSLPDKENNEPKELQEKRRQIQSQIDLARSALSQYTAAAASSVGYRNTYKVYGESDSVQLSLEHLDLELCPLFVHTHPSNSDRNFSGGDISGTIILKHSNLVRGENGITLVIRPKDAKDSKFKLAIHNLERDLGYSNLKLGFYNLLGQYLCESDILSDQSYSKLSIPDETHNRHRESIARATSRYFSGFGYVLYQGGKDGKLLRIEPGECSSLTTTEIISQNALAQFQRFALGSEVHVEQLLQEPDANITPFIGPESNNFEALQLTLAAKYSDLGLPPFNPKELLLSRYHCRGGFRIKTDLELNTTFLSHICQDDLSALFQHGPTRFVESSVNRALSTESIFATTYKITPDGKFIEHAEGGPSLFATFNFKTQKVMDFGTGYFTKKYNPYGMLILNGFLQSPVNSMSYRGSFAVQRVNESLITTPWRQGRYRQFVVSENSMVTYDGEFLRVGDDMRFTGKLTIERTGEMRSVTNLRFYSGIFHSNR
jgi:hypothetical protein